MKRTTLLMATMNPHKLKEASQIFVANGLDKQFELLCMADIGFTGEIPEEEETLEGNASSKAQFAYHLTGMNCFSDDTGLEVDALDGAPGVHSARYAGPECDSSDNIQKLLQRLETVDLPNRTARFRTVISLILEGNELHFEGIVEGEIITNPEGEGGFGYDPVFRPGGFKSSFATMPLEVKNRISHRGRALEAMVAYLLATITR